MNGLSRQAPRFDPLTPRTRRRSTTGPATWFPVLLWLCLACLVSDAAANSERYWNRYRGWKITSFEVLGLPPEMSTQVTGGLALKGSRRLFGMKRPEFSTRLLAEDMARIRVFLAQRGFPLARVVPTAVPVKETRELALTLTVEPGRPVVVKEVQIVGWPELVAPVDSLDKKILRPGERFSDERINETRSRLRYLLLNSGYADVAVETEVSGLDGQSVELVRYVVTAGEFQQIDSVEISGCSDDLLKLARRVLDIDEGIDYSDERMLKAARDLRATQLFDQVDLSTDPISPGSLALLVELRNGKMRTWDAAVGTWSDNPWAVRSSWIHRNLFKRGYGFDVEGVFSTHEVSAGVGVSWLGWLSPRGRTRVGASLLAEDEDAYESREWRIELIQSLRFKERDIWKLGVSVSHVKVESFSSDPDEVPVNEGKLLEFWTDVKWDRTDNPIIPTRGGYLKLSAAFSPPEFFSESPYVQLQFDTARYHKIVSPLMLAGRLRLGWSKPLGGTADILANRRFYAGGYNTMRGYDRRRLGPKDLDNHPRGGQTTVLGGLETRLPLIWLLEGAVFIDAGQVWRNVSDTRLDDISVAFGVAIDLMTPLGPLRGGWAQNIVNQVYEEPKNLWFFGIGYPW